MMGLCNIIGGSEGGGGWGGGVKAIMLGQARFPVTSHPHPVSPHILTWYLGIWREGKK